MKRRSFFKGLAAVVAAVALAPEIAFNAPLHHNWKLTPFWLEESRISFCHTELYKRWLAHTHNLISAENHISDADRQTFAQKFFWGNTCP